MSIFVYYDVMFIIAFLPWSLLKIFYYHVCLFV